MIVLGSHSPRRHEILYEFGIIHKVDSKEIDETMLNNLTPRENVERLSKLKALALIDIYPNDVIIGADTIVVVDNEILGKPKDYNDAVRMLKKLSNKTHHVITGVTIINKGTPYTFSNVSSVTFKELTSDEIDEYISKDNVYDKAGSYAIQSPNMTFITKIEGSYYNIVGLPIEELIDKFNEMNINY